MSYPLCIPHPTTRHVLVLSYTVPDEARTAPHWQRPREDRHHRRHPPDVHTEGFDATLVQHVFPRSDDARVALPDHAAALALLGGDASKLVTMAGHPVMRRGHEVVAHLHTPPPPQQGYEVLPDTMR